MHTSFNFGWFMEYFLKPERSYMSFLEGEFPVDPRDEVWRYVVRGTGEEVQTWTCGRDVARGVVRLLGCEGWVSSFCPFNFMAFFFGVMYGVRFGV